METDRKRKTERVVYLNIKTMNMHSNEASLNCTILVINPIINYRFFSVPYKPIHIHCRIAFLDLMIH